MLEPEDYCSFINKWTVPHFWAKFTNYHSPGCAAQHSGNKAPQARIKCVCVCVFVFVVVCVCGCVRGVVWCGVVQCGAVWCVWRIWFPSWLKSVELEQQSDYYYSSELDCMGIQRFGSPAAFIQITPVVTIIFLVLRHLRYSYSHLRVCSERHFIWPGTEGKVAKQPVLKTFSLCAQKKS